MITLQATPRKKSVLSAIQNFKRASTQLYRQNSMEKIDITDQLTAFGDNKKGTLVESVKAVHSFKEVEIQPTEEPVEAHISDVHPTDVKNLRKRISLMPNVQMRNP